MNEEEKIKERYEKRKNDLNRLPERSLFIKHVVEEREGFYLKIIEQYFKDKRDVEILEIGAGEGGNIDFFRSTGFSDKNIYAAELLPERAKVLREKFKDITVIEGNALNLPFENKFDIVFQSLVFTSILDDDFKQQLADKMWKMLKTGGIILWYDFRFNNPSNKDVKGVDKNEIEKLFAQAGKIDFTSVTLAPPVGRRVGSLYTFINTVFSVFALTLNCSYKKVI